jgi:4-amino-4-deoxy-L-arabinose transferase-like glycosyltransferase
MTSGRESALRGLFRAAVRRPEVTFSILLAVVATLALMGHVLTAPFDRDEHMYVSAGVLWPSHRLYADFLFLQMPYLPMVYSGVFDATGAERLLFTARLITAGVTLITVVLTGGMAFRLARDGVVAAAAVLLLCASPAVQNAVGQASNYAAPMAAAAGGLAFLLYPRVLKLRDFACSGVCLGLAIGLKLYYATLVAPFVIGCLLVPAEARTPLRLRLAAFLGGLAVSLMPALYLAIRDPTAFVFANVGYHALNAQWWAQTGLPMALTLGAKLRFARWIASAYPHLVLAAATLAGAVAWWRCLPRQSRGGQSAAITIGLVTLTALVTALAPSPSWPQYFAMAMPFAVLMPAALVACTGQRPAAWLRVGVGALAVTAAISAGGTLAPALARLVTPAEWTGNVVHEQAAAIRRLMPDAGRNDRVLTLAPLFALEAGLGIYPELASGPFVYRVSHLMPHKVDDPLVALGPDDLQATMTAVRPRAILLAANEGELNTPLAEAASRFGFRPVWSSDLLTLLTP